MASVVAVETAVELGTTTVRVGGGVGGGAVVDCSTVGAAVDPHASAASMTTMFRIQ
jgi:hypothetical protein